MTNWLVVLAIGCKLAIEGNNTPLASMPKESTSLKMSISNYEIVHFETHREIFEGHKFQDNVDIHGHSWQYCFEASQACNISTTPKQDTY